MSQKLGRALLYGFGFTLFSILILSLIITSIAYFEWVSVSVIEKIIYVCSMGIFFLSAMITAKIIATKGWMVGGLFGLLLVVCTALYQLIGLDASLTLEFLIRGLIVLVVSVSGGMIGVNLPTKTVK